MKRPAEVTPSPRHAARPRIFGANINPVVLAGPHMDVDDSGTGDQNVAARSAPGATTSTRQSGKQGEDFALGQRLLLVDNIDFPNAGASVGKRLGSTIRLSGIRICETVVNDLDFAVTFHWALLQPKSRGDIDVSEIKQEFFRETEGPDRNRAFIDAKDGDTYEYFYSCNGINPDKFNILTHMKKVLAPRDVTKDSTFNFHNMDTRNYTFHLDKYFNFKGKRMTFLNDADTVPEHPIIRVMWFQAHSFVDWETVNPQLATIARSSKATVYFRNGMS